MTVVDLFGVFDFLLGGAFFGFFEEALVVFGFRAILDR
jgi:hypothetical protein